MHVQPELSHRQARNLFFDALDEALPAPEQQRLRMHLDGCSDCRAGYTRYEHTVRRVRSVEREQSPPALATTLMRRLRRRRPFGHRGLQLMHAHYRLPVEIILPLLLGVMVAAFLMLVAP